MWLIAAYSVPGRVIGMQGRLPWSRPADLRHFKAVTMGRSLIMGRTTWQSLGRPLPGRYCVVLTRRPGFLAHGAEVVGDWDAAIAAARAAMPGEPIVIGGAQIYAQALGRGLIDRAYLTEIACEVPGDAFMPELPGRWRTVATSQDGDCTFKELHREDAP